MGMMGVWCSNGLKTTSTIAIFIAGLGNDEMLKSLIMATMAETNIGCEGNWNCKNDMLVDTYWNGGNNASFAKFYVNRLSLNLANINDLVKARSKRPWLLS